MAGQNCAGQATGRLGEGDEASSDASACASTLKLWVAAFAVVQLLLSQLRDFHALW